MGERGKRWKWGLKYYLGGFFSLIEMELNYNSSLIINGSDNWVFGKGGFTEKGIVDGGDEKQKGTGVSFGLTSLRLGLGCEGSFMARSR